MQIALKITLLSMCLGVAMAGAPLSIAARTDLGLMQLMMATSETTQANQPRNMACFDYYVPVLNNITNEYERSYKQCVDNADEARVDVDASTTEERKALVDAGEGSCKLLQDCSEKPNSLDLFECYSAVGSENARTMFTISANASETYAVVLEKYRLVQNEQFRCTNASERAYVEDTANTYSALQSCLMGLSSVPVVTTTTEAAIDTTTTLATTTEPESTTVDNTEAPAEDDVVPAELNVHKARMGGILKKLSQYI